MTKTGTSKKKTSSASKSRANAPASKPAKKVGKAFMPKAQYSEMVKGLMDQGLDRDDAIQTLKVGLRQANGLPVPQELLTLAGGSTNPEREQASHE